MAQLGDIMSKPLPGRIAVAQPKSSIVAVLCAWHNSEWDLQMFDNVLYNSPLRCSAQHWTTSCVENSLNVLVKDV